MDDERCSEVSSMIYQIFVKKDTVLRYQISVKKDTRFCTKYEQNTMRGYFQKVTYNMNQKRNKYSPRQHVRSISTKYTGQRKFGDSFKA